MKSENSSTTSSQAPSSCTSSKSANPTGTQRVGWSLANRGPPRQQQQQVKSPTSPQAGQQAAPQTRQQVTRSPISAVESLSATGGSVSSRSTTRTTGSLLFQQQQQYCAGNKFHRAAIDGYVDMLCEASKRDTNTHAPDDFLALTPTLLAAQAGQLEALRILVGRGGDPERVSSLGSSALHLAAARNHLNCVSFLVNFGANMWALDNELHTAKDIAGLNQCKQVLDYLDQMMAKQSAINTKLVQKLKDKAKVAAEKRLKQMRKQQLKAIKQVERDERLLAKLSNNRRLLKTAHSMSDIKLVGRANSSSTATTTTTTTNSVHEHATHLAAISFSPNEPLSTPQGLTGGPKRVGPPSAVSNFLSQRFQPPPAPGSNQRNKHLNHHHSDLDSSYCSSSVSSASNGYLSSCSARSILKSALASRTHRAAGRLAGVVPPQLRGGAEIAIAPGQVVEAAAQVEEAKQAGQAVPRRPRYSDLVAVNQGESAARRQAESESRPGKSESILSTRLRGLGGGVSRKVRLKRLLFAAAAATAGPNGQRDGDRSRTQNESGNELAEGSSLKRTRSEPDFGAAMRDEGCDPDEDDEQADAQSDYQPSEDEEADEEEEAEDEAAEERRANIPTPPPEPPGPGLSSCRSANLEADQSEGPGGQGNADRDPDPQQHLLTRCLSQLKFQQQQIRVPAGTTTANQQKLLCTSNSDELIRHQLTASEFPLRPSVIKQQLHLRQQQQQQRQQPHLAGADCAPDRRQRKSTTVMSVDSIGSVGSFARRNLSEPAHRQGDHQMPYDARPGGDHKELDRMVERRGSGSGSSSSSDSSALSSASFEGSSSSSRDPNNNHQPGVPDESVARFLAANNLLELSPVLARERIDFEALLLLTEADLKSLSILLGPRRKLLNAIAQHRSRGKSTAVAHMSGASERAAHAFTVVDTQF